MPRQQERVVKQVVLTCPFCLAKNIADVGETQATCEYCGESFPVEIQTKEPQTPSASTAQMQDYLDIVKQNPQTRTDAAESSLVEQQTETSQKKGNWLALWIVGWVFCFPIPTTILAYRKCRKKRGIVLSVVVAFFVFDICMSIYFAFLTGAFGGGKKIPNNTVTTESAQELSSADETKGKAEDDEVTEPGDTSASTDDGAQANGGESASNVIILKANVPGEYGRNFTVYGGGSEQDVGTRLGWFIPEGTYSVKNLSKSGPWEQVNYGLPEPTVNDDGFKESSQFECVLVKPDEPMDIYVPEGGCVYITGNNGKLELTRR